MRGHAMLRAAAGGVTSALYKDAVMSDGPLAYWRLGESSGATAADSSGHGYAATYANCIQGAPSLVSNSSGDLSVSGNGTNSQITVGAVASLYGLNRSAAIEAWIKPSSVSSGFLSGIWSAGVGGICIRQNGSGIEVLKDYSASLGVIAVGLSAGVKAHIVFVIDSAGLITVYSNGVAKGTINASSTTFAGSYVRIGADGRDSTIVGTFLSGSIDEVAVYAAPLSAARVLAHYNAGK